MSSLPESSGLSGMKKPDDMHCDIHDYVKPDMGELRYKMLKRSKSVMLQNIYIRSTALLSFKDNQKGLVNHDAAVVELSAHNGTMYHIHAEKMMDGSGITLRLMRDFEFDRELDVKYDCFGSAIPFKKVMTVLKTPPPKFDLVGANCWQYAATVTCDLIEKILETTRSEVRRTKLTSVHKAAQQHLEDTMTIIPRTAFATLEKFLPSPVATTIVAAGLALHTFLGK